MSRFTFQESENYGAQKNNYFSLKDDKDTAIIRFLFNTINDVQGVAVHEVKVGDIVEIKFGDKTSKFEIIEIPKVQGKNMPEMIKIL